MTTEPHVQAIASALNVMRPDDDRLEVWIGAMRSGDYKFGFGLLRSADDEYDPFGVLAAITAPEWEWDDAEGAWAIDNSPLFLSPDRVAEGLNIPYHPDLKQGVNEVVTRFQDALTAIADGSQTFAEVAKLLNDGAVRAKQERERLLRHKSDRIRSIGDSYETDLQYRGSRSPYYSGYR